jgi:hypothetical protein
MVGLRASSPVGQESAAEESRRVEYLKV